MCNISVTPAPKNKKASPVTEKEFCESIHRNDSVSLTTELESVKQLMQTKTGVYVLEDGGTAMVTRAWLARCRTNYRHTVFYFFDR